MDNPPDVLDAGPLDAADVPRMDRPPSDDGPATPDALLDGDAITPPPDGGRCAFDQAYLYGFEGGNTASMDQTALSPMRGYTRRRTYADPGRMPDECMTELPACSVPKGINVGDVMDAIHDPDVQAALAAAGPDPFVYGHDSRPEDGQVFVFRRAADGRGFAVGDPCGGRPDCREIPAGLGQLVGLLYALDQQELARPACAMLR